MEDKDKKQNENYICRAQIINSTATDEYDFECVAVPEKNGQIRYSYNNDEYFNQVLRTGKDNVKIERLESGLPLFDNHPWDNSAKNTLGISVGYYFDERGIILRCKFGARADEALRQDVANGIIKTVSIEGSIINYSVERNQNQIPTYYAELWEPESLSFAPVPNDIGASITVKRAIEKQIKSSTEEKSIYKQLTKKF